jgi:archaemetzincin
MRIGILRIGQPKSDPTDRIREMLSATFPETAIAVIEKEMCIPEEAFDETRKQYRSDTILMEIRNFADTRQEFDRILGITGVDLFALPMNFVFGEAEHPGKAAIISFWRLRPEFYQRPPNEELFGERCAKEAIHEIGHTLGLDHCDNPFCVMHFSNSILETDVKKSFFCKRCASEVEAALIEFGKDLERKV